VRAIDLAIQQYISNSPRTQIEHIKLDGSFEESGDWSRDAEMQNAQKAANDPMALAYIGPYTSGGAAVSLPITNRAGLLQIGVSHTWPGLTMVGWDEGEPDRYRPADRHNYVRLSAPDTAQGEAAAYWADDLGVRTMVVVNDGSSYSQGLSKWFEVAARDAGISITGAVEIGTESLEYAIAEINQLRPDALFYAPSSTNQAVMFAKAIESVEASQRIFATDTALDDRFLASTSAKAVSWHVVSNSTVELPTSAQETRFKQDYIGVYGDEPRLYAANAYDATKLVLEAVSSGSVDRATIIEAVCATVDYPGASGVVSFSENGDRHGWRINGYRVKDEIFVLDRLLIARP